MLSLYRRGFKITSKNILMSTIRRLSLMLKGISPKLREIYNFKTICLRGMLTSKKMKSITLKKLLKNLPQKMSNTMLTFAKNRKQWKSLLESSMNKIIKSRC
jgi:hypothetical protein